MTFRFLPNPRFEAEFLASRDGQNLVEETAEEIAERVRAVAPVDTGEYRDSIYAEGGEVGSTDDKANIIEYGSSDTPTFAPLRRGAEQVVGTENVQA